MTLDSKYAACISFFEASMPHPKTELDYNSPYQLLVAVILSAQCTDKRVNQITPQLFKNYPSPYELANAKIEDIFNTIRSCSYPNNKAKHLWGMANKLITDFNGKVPDLVTDLETLPGVGRKTAHVIASVIFNKPTLAVDTHVFRVSERIGLTKNAKNPLDCEKQIVSNTPQELIHNMHHWLILHGRYTCTAIKPKCKVCGINTICDFLKS